jgi:hydrogenase expression/formation protein HypC
MCLGVPGKIIEINAAGDLATVDFWGVRRQVRLDIIDEPATVGDYVLNHVGFAIRRIPPESVAETLSLYELLLQESGDDVMAGDIKGEIEGADAIDPIKAS